MCNVHISIATPESDARLRKEYNRKGYLAKENDQPRIPPGDPTSLVASWWFEGYDNAIIQGEAT